MQRKLNLNFFKFDTRIKNKSKFYKYKEIKLL